MKERLSVHGNNFFSFPIPSLQQFFITTSLLCFCLLCAVSLNAYFSQTNKIKGVEYKKEEEFSIDQTALFSTLILLVYFVLYFSLMAICQYYIGFKS